MTNVPTWISRVSAIALATASVTALASAPNAPDFLMHKANVSLKVSSQGSTKIEKDTVKTKDVINLLMGRPIDAKNEKDETLGLVTQCDAESGADSALVVYDKKTEQVISDDGIIFELGEEAIELDKNGNLKKADSISFADVEGGFLDVTGETSFGKIGNKCAQDGDNKDHWNKDAICVKKFKSKSITGLDFGFFGGSIVMSGKISAGSCQFAADDGVFPGISFGITKNATGINYGDGTIADESPVVENAGDIVSYDVKVTNLSDETATGVKVGDFLSNVVVSCPGSTLAGGASMRCTADLTVSQTDIDGACGPSTGGPGGTIENIATVTADGTNSFGANEFVAVDCEGDPENDGLFIVKSDDTEGTSQGAGSTIGYTIKVTNLSGIEQTGVTVNDTLIDTLAGCDAAGTILADGESMTCTGSYTVTQDDMDFWCFHGDHLINVATTTSDDLNSFGANDLVELNCASTNPPQ